MADNPNVNQTLDRRREEKVAEHLMQDNVSRLANIAVDGWRSSRSISRSGLGSPTTGATRLTPPRRRLTR